MHRDILEEAILWLGLLVGIFVTCAVFAEETPVGGLYIHPDMQRAIQENEKNTLHGAEESDFIIIDGKKRYTGFRPTSQFYMGASSLNFKVDPTLELPKNFDIRKMSFSPVRGQIQGSCWAEGNASAFELTWNLILGTKHVFAVNDVIDCSGFGTARYGGQLSMEYNVSEGLAFESDYKYTGRDGRCKATIERHQPLKSAPFLRGAEGKFPTEKELMAASYQYGAFEVCGSAGSLGNGGRQDTPRNGQTNHCYAYAGWLDGKELGWLDAKYHIIKNSWGDGTNSPLNLARGDWGDEGYGYYRLSKDGERLLGSVITEIQVANTGLPLRRPEPTTFTIETDKLVQTVTVKPGARFEVAQLKASLESALKGMK